jgi:site-specific DNA-cytosine methylase
MKLLELFSGTGSVGKVAEELGYEVISVDITDKLHPVSHLCDILTWDYTIYPEGHFDVIWASPPCRSFSCLQRCKKPKVEIDTLIQTVGLPPLRKAEEIIEYFKPTKWFIENPQTGRMKEFVDKPFYDVDYCMYCDWGYKKRTRVWTNIIDFEPKTCNKQCGTCVDGKHNVHIGRPRGKTSLSDRYRIPPQLIYNLLTNNN